MFGLAQRCAVQNGFRFVIRSHSQWHMAHKRQNYRKI